jgi:ketosteroid isomerase-like protein
MNSNSKIQAMNKMLLLVWLIFVLFSCTDNKPIADPQVLADADIAFSDYSVKYGIQKAFIEFADDSMVILRDKQMPLVNKQNLIKSYEGKSDSGVVLTWNPAKAIIAKSGELGYTYGFWKLIAQKDTSEGTYMTVWKKDMNGRWKYIADTGNQGLSNK